MNSFKAALIREQGVEFAVVAVKPHVVSSNLAADDAFRAFQPLFPGVPIVLAASVARGVEYRGRTDLVRFLASIDPGRIPWRRWTVN